MSRWTSIQAITWFLELQKTNRLDLEPPYQRKSVWALKDRRYFLDTIFRNYPCPAIFIHQDTDEMGKTTYRVIDGKQRLETIIRFSNNEIGIDAKYGNVDFAGKKFNELSLENKKKFWNYTISVDFIDVPDTINEIFDRLNRVSKTLTPQELRHARHDGWFITEAECEAENPFWERVKISTNARSKRMQDVQFISELLIILLEKKISTFNQEHINTIYSEYDDIFDTENVFDWHSYLSEKERIKEYISQMIYSDNDITKWTKIFTNFHTLWALIALFDSELPDPKKLASKYKVFMKKVDSVTKEIEPQGLLGKEKQASVYYSNSSGASADLKPRNERYDSLKAALLDDEDNGAD